MFSLVQYCTLIVRAIMSIQNTSKKIEIYDKEKIYNRSKKYTFLTKIYFCLPDIFKPVFKYKINFEICVLAL